MERSATELETLARDHATWRVETISDLDTMRRNAWRWLDVERDCVDPDAAFQSFAWCLAWAQTWCSANGPSELAVKFIYRGETLVAILPLAVEQVEGVKLLTMLGHPHTQLANALTRPDHDATDGLLLALAEAELTSGADAIQLSAIPQGSALAKAATRSRRQVLGDPAEHTSFVTWDGMANGEDFLSGTSRTFRRDFARKWRRLRREGKPHFETLDASSYRFSDFVGQALAMKRDWLNANGLAGSGLTRTNTEKFLHALDTHDGTFHPEIDILTLDGAPLAFSINITGNGCRNGWLSSYRLDAARHSPGMLMHHLSIAGAVDAGLSRYEFLGHPTPFKAAMCNGATPLLRYEQALSTKGRVWLDYWSNGLRQIAVKSYRQLRRWTR
ncbi:MAG: GNAT family N-acetyltransferase [Ahrensia sp.]|nr:GNAT family N-acetyltransferase [Ahrensia sp.]